MTRALNAERESRIKEAESNSAQADEGFVRSKVLPCGRSAHTEAGWCKDRGMKTIVYIPKMEEPELMYKLFDAVTDSIEGIQEAIDK